MVKFHIWAVVILLMIAVGVGLVGGEWVRVKPHDEPPVIVVPKNYGILQR